MKNFFLITFRNQILFGFLLVMSVVLIIVSTITFQIVSSLLKNNSERQIQQTAVQANGRLDALIAQIDTLTLQIASDSQVQNILNMEAAGTPASFETRQSLVRIVNLAQIFSDGLQSVELYDADYQQLYPLGARNLANRLPSSWIREADRQNGRLVWVGIDPQDPETVLAVRRIRLMDRWFTHGGYLLAEIDRDFFRSREPFLMKEEQGLMILADRDARIISSNVQENLPELPTLLHTDRQTVSVKGQDYVIVRQKAAVAGWTLVILTPVGQITEGLSVLRTATVASGAVGSMLFLAMALLLSTLITRPIRRLIQAMRKARLGKLKANPEHYYNREMNELNRTYNEMVEDTNRLIQLVYEKEILQSRTELKALQAQINPHFLFNTLEAFYWSLQEKGEEELAGLMVSLSHLFRYTITRSGKDEWVTVGQELDQVERYLHLMKMRLGDRLTWNMEADPRFLHVKIPKLLIQPLVENAIRHGIEPKVGPGRVTLRLESARFPSQMIITIEDDGVGIEDEKQKAIVEHLKTGVPLSGEIGLGIQNIYRRLKLYFADGNEHAPDLTLSSIPGQGTRVSLIVPVREEETHATKQNDPDRGR